MDPMKELLEGMPEGMRRKMEQELFNEIMTRRWRHPISVLVNGKYHKCAHCGDPIGEDVIVVVHRASKGDTIRVFDKQECLEHYDWSEQHG